MPKHQSISTPTTNSDDLPNTDRSLLSETSRKLNTLLPINSIRIWRLDDEMVCQLNCKLNGFIWCQQRCSCVLLWLRAARECDDAISNETVQFCQWLRVNDWRGWSWKDGRGRSEGKLICIWRLAGNAFDCESILIIIWNYCYLMILTNDGWRAIASAMDEKNRIYKTEVIEIADWVDTMMWFRLALENLSRRLTSE